ncbi:MAG: heme exporter protein CcmB [Candidatus Marinimicrobia bacterium]|nr:heme exporter protein CcmB [Candidatus Neomarinimicrobiota bacterium]
MAAFWTVLGKELQLEWRTRESLAVMAVFSLSVILLFAFAFNAGSTSIKLFAPGLLWMTYFFSAVLGLLRSFGREREMDAYDLLISSPIDRGDIFLGKALAFALLLALTQLVSLPLFSLFLDIPLAAASPMIVPIFLLADVAIAAVGTVVAGIGLRSPHGDTLLPVLLFPLLTPMLIATTRATSAALAGRPAGEYGIWLMLLFTYSVVFLLLGTFIFDYISEE